MVGPYIARETAGDFEPQQMLVDRATAIGPAHITDARRNIYAFEQAKDAADEDLLMRPTKYERLDLADRTLLSGVPADWLGQPDLSYDEAQELVMMVAEGGGEYLAEL